MNTTKEYNERPVRGRLEEEGEEEKRGSSLENPDWYLNARRITIESNRIESSRSHPRCSKEKKEKNRMNVLRTTFKRARRALINIVVKKKKRKKKSFPFSFLYVYISGSQSNGKR